MRDLRVPGGGPGEQGQGELDERTDGEREGDGADPGRAAEREAGGQRAGLDRGADDADGVAAAGQPGHQPVARAGAEAGADVEPGAGRGADDAGSEEGDPDAELTGGGQQPQDRVGRKPDTQDVADGAEAGPLPQRDPRQHHDGPDAVDDPADGQVEALGEALVQHVPRPEPEPRPHHQRQAGAEAGEPDVEADQLTAEAGY
jgi:hypothetical protein